MKIRLRITSFVLLVALLVALLGWAGWHYSRTPEPEYQGKKLSAWLRAMEGAAGPDSASVSNAAHAVRAIGTNAIPNLLAMLAADNPRWQIRTVSWLQDTLNVNLHSKLASADRARALSAFMVLGRIASPAIPELAARLTNSNPAIAEHAFMALVEIDDAATVPPLLGLITNSSSSFSASFRDLATTRLGMLRSQASAAVPTLEVALHDPDAGLRAAAARALGRIGMGSDQTIRALITTLSDTNARVRNSAAMGLAGFGTRAEAALPLLRTLPDEPDQSGRHPMAHAIVRVQCEMREGGIVRGPKAEKRIALVFTGHEYGEGGETVLAELQKHNARASFFMTGVFLDKPDFGGLLDRIVGHGHYLGPHSNQHLLYCSWETPPRTLVTEAEYSTDLITNVGKAQRHGFQPVNFRRFFLPPFEHYNREIVDWAGERGFTVINYTPGTRSNADYTGEADQNFVSSQAIFDSIVKREREDPHGLNGFILLLHIGSGPGRADKFHARFGELLDYLAGKGYEFVRVDALLDPKDNP